LVFLCQDNGKLWMKLNVSESQQRLALAACSSRLAYGSAEASRSETASCHFLLRREGHAVNRKRVQRLYREERLAVRRRGGRKRAIGTRRPLETPLVANLRWSLDFVSDQMTDGRRSGS
jgi:putative transposase